MSWPLYNHCIHNCNLIQYACFLPQCNVFLTCVLNKANEYEVIYPLNMFYTFLKSLTSSVCLILSMFTLVCLLSSRSTSGDMVQFVEQSLDTNLLNNAVRLHIPNCLLLPGGVSIQETLNNVIILIVTSQSVHRLVLPHPSHMYRSVSVWTFAFRWQFLTAAKSKWFFFPCRCS